MQGMTHRHSRALDIFYNEHKDSCTNCGRAFVDGMCAHLGYLADRDPAVLCDECSTMLEETVARYHWMKDEFDKPDPTAKLWRYMDLGKFVHLISTKKLHFASADSLDDPFEGAKGLIERKEQWDGFYLDFFCEAIRTVPRATPEMLESQNVEREAQRLLTEMNQNSDWYRKHTVVSCWHCNEFESEAMWKLYSVNTQNAIAIQTTTAHLYEALDRNPYISIGKVQYIDYNHRFSSVNGACWFKRKSFEYEREVRAIAFDIKSTTGIQVPIDIGTLIDSVYISPYAPKWFEEVVRSVADKFEVTAPIVFSEMAKRPFY